MKCHNPCDVKFADKVYSIVSQIPLGQTLTYSKVAELAGNEKAARAVGNILNKNRDFDKIPCHRVIRSDGTAGGYVFGSEKKKARLLSEAAI